MSGCKPCKCKANKAAAKPKVYNCPACNVEIPHERIEILKQLNYAEHNFFCVKHAINKPVKAIYSGENGTSELIMCDRVDDDNVRNKFYDPEVSFDSVDTPEDVNPPDLDE